MSDTPAQNAAQTPADLPVGVPGEDPTLAQSSRTADPESGAVQQTGSGSAGTEETIGATGQAQEGDSALVKDPSDWVSGDDPMTEAQKSYLDTLAKEAGEELPADLTKAEASEHIDRLRGSQS